MCSHTHVRPVDVPGQNAFLSKVTTNEKLTCLELFHLCFQFAHRRHPTFITPSFKYQRAPSRVWSISASLLPGPMVSPGKRVPEERTHSLSEQRFFLLPRFSLRSLTCSITQYPQTYGADFVLSPQPHRDWKGALPRTVPASPCMFCDIRIALHSDIRTRPPCFYFTTSSQSLIS